MWLLSICYTLSLGGLAFFCLPRFLYQYWVKKKYRRHLRQRLGKQPLPTVHGRSVWIHAASVGETRAIAPLARKIKESYPHLSLFVTSITETGHAEARRSLSFADGHFYLPFDFKSL